MAGGPPLQPPFSGKLAETMAAATAAHRQGRLDEALRLYAKALNLDRNLFQALFLTGVAHLQRGDAKAALAPRAAATRADPRSADALANYGVALAVTGDPPQALAVLDARWPWHPAIPAPSSTSQCPARPWP